MMDKNTKEPSIEERLTGSVTKGLDPNSPVQPDAELEGGEYLQYPDGVIQRVVGEKHEKDGVKMSMPDGTKILSARLNIKPKDISFLKKTFDIDLSSKDTYATAIGKYEKKIGLHKLNEEQEELFKILKKKSETASTPGTSRLNQEYLSLKIKGVEDQKKKLEPEHNTFFETVFNMQESYEKPEGKGKEFAYGGLSDKNFQNICTKYGISKEEGMQILDRVPKYAHGGPVKSNTQSAEEVGQNFAHMVRRDDTLGSKSEWVSPEEYASFKGVKTKLGLDASGFPLVGGTTSRYTDYIDKRESFAFGGLKKYGDGGFKTLSLKENLTGEDINTALKNKDITLDEANQLELLLTQPTTPSGDLVTTENVKVKGPDGKYVYYNDLPEDYKGKTRGVAAVAKFVSNYESTPTYKFSEVTGQASKDRLWSLIDMWGGLEGVTKENINSADKTTLDKIAGKLQDKVVNEVPELAVDYGLNVAPTRQGLEWLVKNKSIDPKEYPSLFKDGKPLRGSYESPEARAAFKEVVKNIPEEKMKEYAEANYKDNSWYFRSIAKKQVEFDNEDEYRKWLVDHKGDRVGESGFYKTDKEGAYAQPVLYKEKEFKNKEEADAWVKDRKLDGTYGSFYNGDESNIFERPKYPGMEEAVEPAKKGDEIKNDIIVGNKKYPRLFASPDQNPLPPSPMDPHLMGETRLGRIDPIRIGVETQMQQASEALRFVTQQYDHLPPEQRAAAIASAQVNIQKSINDSITQANGINAANVASSELFNIGQADREQEAGLRNKLSFEQRQFTAKAKTEEELRNYYDRLTEISVNDFKNNQNLNLLETFSPNYSLDYSGAGISYNPSSNYQIGAGNSGEEFMKQEIARQMAASNSKK